MNEQWNRFMNQLKVHIIHYYYLCQEKGTTGILEKNIQNDSELDASYYIWIRVRIEETVY